MFFVELKKILCMFVLCKSIPLFGMEEKKPDFVLSLKQVCKKVVLETCSPEEVIATLPNDLVDELSNYATTISKGLLVSKALKNCILEDYFLDDDEKPFNFCVKDDKNAYPQYMFYKRDSQIDGINDSICFTCNDREMLKRIAHFTDKRDLIKKIYDVVFIRYAWLKPSVSLDAIEHLRMLKIYKLLEYCAMPSRQMVNLDYLHGLFEGHRDEEHISCFKWHIKNLIDLSNPPRVSGLFNPSCSILIEENDDKEKSEIMHDDEQWLRFFKKLHTKAFFYGLSIDRNKVNEVDFRNRSVSKNVCIIKAFLMPYVANIFFKQKQIRRIEKDKDPSREQGIPSVGSVPYVSAFSKLFDTFDGTKEIYFHMNYHCYYYTRTLYAPLRKLSICYKKNKLPNKYTKGYLNLFDLEYTNLFELFKTLQQESNNYKIATIHSLYDAIADELPEIPQIDTHFSEIRAQVLVHKIREIILQKEYELILPDDHYYSLKTRERTTAKNRDSTLLKLVREYFPQKSCSYREKVGKCSLQ